MPSLTIARSAATASRRSTWQRRRWPAVTPRSSSAAVWVWLWRWNGP